MKKSLTIRINVTPIVLDLMMSEGIDVVAGCADGRSIAGGILAELCEVSRWAAEDAVLKSLRVIHVAGRMNVARAG